MNETNELRQSENVTISNVPVHSLSAVTLIMINMLVYLNLNFNLRSILHWPSQNEFQLGSNVLGCCCVIYLFICCLCLCLPVCLCPQIGYLFFILLFLLWQTLYDRKLCVILLAVYSMMVFSSLIKTSTISSSSSSRFNSSVSTSVAGEERTKLVLCTLKKKKKKMNFRLRLTVA